MIQGRRFLLPHDATWLLSDASHWGELTAAPTPSFKGSLLEKRGGGRHGLLVLDPPWSNKSVKRARAYPTMTLEDISRLPVKELLHPEGAVSE